MSTLHYDTTKHIYVNFICQKKIYFSSIYKEPNRVFRFGCANFYPFFSFHKTKTFAGPTTSALTLYLSALIFFYSKKKSLQFFWTVFIHSIEYIAWELVKFALNMLILIRGMGKGHITDEMHKFK